MLSILSVMRSQCSILCTTPRRRYGMCVLVSHYHWRHSSPQFYLIQNSVLSLICLSPCSLGLNQNRRKSYGFMAKNSDFFYSHHCAVDQRYAQPPNALIDNIALWRLLITGYPLYENCASLIFKQYHFRNHKKLLFRIGLQLKQHKDIYICFSISG